MVAQHAKVAFCVRNMVSQYAEVAFWVRNMVAQYAEVAFWVRNMVAQYAKVAFWVQNMVAQHCGSVFQGLDNKKTSPMGRFFRFIGELRINFAYGQLGSLAVKFV